MRPSTTEKLKSCFEYIKNDLNLEAKLRNYRYEFIFETPEKIEGTELGVALKRFEELYDVAIDIDNAKSPLAIERSNNGNKFFHIVELSSTRDLRNFQSSLGADGVMLYS